MGRKILEVNNRANSGARIIEKSETSSFCYSCAKGYFSELQTDRGGVFRQCQFCGKLVKMELGSPNKFCRNSQKSIGIGW